MKGLCCVRVSFINVCAGNAQPTRRYKGPYVSELSMQSLSQAPKPWPAFFMGEKSASSRATYTLPADTTMLLDRIEENLVFFLVRLFRFRKSRAGLMSDLSTDSLHSTLCAMRTYRA